MTCKNLWFIGVSPDNPFFYKTENVYKLIDNAFEYLTNYSNQAKPNELFQLLWMWNLSPSVLLTKHHFNKKGILLLIEELTYNYKKFEQPIPLS